MDFSYETGVGDTKISYAIRKYFDDNSVYKTNFEGKYLEDLVKFLMILALDEKQRSLIYDENKLTFDKKDFQFIFDELLFYLDINYTHNQLIKQIDILPKLQTIKDMFGNVDDIESNFVFLDKLKNLHRKLSEKHDQNLISAFITSFGTAHKEIDSLFIKNTYEQIPELNKMLEEKNNITDDQCDIIIANLSNVLNLFFNERIETYYNDDIFNPIMILNEYSCNLYNKLKSEKNVKDTQAYKLFIETNNKTYNTVIDWCKFFVDCYIVKFNIIVFNTSLEHSSEELKNNKKTAKEALDEAINNTQLDDNFLVKFI